MNIKNTYFGIFELPERPSWQEGRLGEEQREACNEGKGREGGEIGGLSDPQVVDWLQTKRGVCGLVKSTASAHENLTQCSGAAGSNRAGSLSWF